MKEILELIITNLVDDKNAISIEEITEGNVITFKVSVSIDDMGKVIGKQGRIAKAIRVLMKAYATKEGKKVNVEILD